MVALRRSECLLLAGVSALAASAGARSRSAKTNESSSTRTTQRRSPRSKRGEERTCCSAGRKRYCASSVAARCCRQKKLSPLSPAVTSLSLHTQRRGGAAPRMLTTGISPEAGEPGCAYRSPQSRAASNVTARSLLPASVPPSVAESPGWPSLAAPPASASVASSCSPCRRRPGSSRTKRHCARCCVHQEACASAERARSRCEPITTKRSCESSSGVRVPRRRASMGSSIPVPAGVHSARLPQSAQSSP